MIILNNQAKELTLSINQNFFFHIMVLERETQNYQKLYRIEKLRFYTNS